MSDLPDGGHRMPPHQRAMIVGPLLSWESQVKQYPTYGDPGLGYFAGDVSEDHPGVPPVDCLLYRVGPPGVAVVVGILNHYPVDYEPWERAGNVNMWVKRQWQRRGIGTRLLTEADRRWGPINFDQQRYTATGLAFVYKWEKEHR